MISRWCRANSQTSIGRALTHDPGGTPLGQVLRGKLGNSQQEIGKGRDLALQLGPFFIRDDDDGGSAAMLGNRRRFTLLGRLDDGLQCRLDFAKLQFFHRLATICDDKN